MKRGVNLMAQLASQLKNIDHDEQTALLLGFLRQDEMVARRFIEYCTAETKMRGSDKEWNKIKKSLDNKIKQENEEMEQQKKTQFLKDLKKFKVDCFAGEYLEEADFDDKRHAYADGDIYFEDFIWTFVDDHLGFQTYIDFLKDADKYYKNGDFITASKAYSILLEIYKLDTEVKKCFVNDDDFPDLDLGEISEVDAKEMNKRWNDSLLKLKAQHRSRGSSRKNNTQR